MDTLTIAFHTALEYIECYFVSYAIGVLSAVFVVLISKLNRRNRRVQRMIEFRRSRGKSKVNV